MKKLILSMLAVLLLVSTGCTKREERQTNTTQNDGHHSVDHESHHHK